MAGDKGEFMRVMVNPAVYGVLKYISRGGGKFVELSFVNMMVAMRNTYGSSQHRDPLQEVERFFLRRRFIFAFCFFRWGILRKRLKLPVGDRVPYFLVALDIDGFRTG